jgi:hypothetical protein
MQTDPSGFLEWCQNSALSAIIRHETWTVPAIEILHIAGVILIFGSVLVTNLRLLGRMFLSEPAGSLAADLSRWMRLGLIVLVCTGPLLFFAMPVKLFMTPDFTIKLVLVAIAAGYHLRVHRKLLSAAANDATPDAPLKKSARISLTLWSIAILAGVELGAFS